jgi:CDP-glucose 4,6-dehydratase
VKKEFGVFRNKKVLITGDTGFKGSWLSYWLYLMGASVYGFALPPLHAYDHYSLLGLGDCITHADGDIRDYEQVRNIIRSVNPEFVFHLAAQPLVRKSYAEPKITFDTNIGGSVNVLEAVRGSPSVKSLVMITSDKCYYNKEWVWGYREIDELGGKDPYSASKAAAELVILAYQNSFFFTRPGFGAASVRAGNVIGGGDWSDDRIVPDCIKALKDKRPVVLRNPASTRPWQHVLEPLSGYLLLAAKLHSNPEKFRGSYNFGPDGSMHTVRELVEEVMATWGEGSVETGIEGENTLPEAGVLHLNCDKAHTCLGWYPRWDFKTTVEKTVTWYKSVKNGADAQVITKEQINEYMGDI